MSCATGLLITGFTNVACGVLLTGCYAGSFCAESRLAELSGLRSALLATRLPMYFAPIMGFYEAGTCISRPRPEFEMPEEACLLILAIIGGRFLPKSDNYGVYCLPVFEDRTGPGMATGCAYFP